MPPIPPPPLFPPVPVIAMSQMVVASAIANTDLFAGLVGLGNAMIPRTVIFQASGSDDLPLSAGGTNFVLRNTGECELNLAIGQTFNLHGSSGAFFHVRDDGDTFHNIDATGQFEIDHASGSIVLIDTAGNVQAACGPGAFFVFFGGANVFQMTDGGGFIIQCGASEDITISYHADDPTDWDVAPPTDIWDAIDRIASYIAFLAGAPIP